VESNGVEIPAWWCKPRLDSCHKPRPPAGSFGKNTAALGKPSISGIVDVRRMSVCRHIVRSAVSRSNGLG